MAKVRDPLHSNEARGRYGGDVFNTCKGVRYVKRNTAPTNQGTVRRLIVRAILAQVSKSWSDILSTQRTAWDNWATSHGITDWSGVRRFMSGFGAYCRCNCRLADMGYALIEDPPVVAAPNYLPGFSAADGVGSSVTGWSPTAGSNLTVRVWIFGPHSAGRKGRIENAVFKQAAAGETGTTTITGLSPGTHTFWAQVVSEDDGQASTFMVDTATIT